MRTLKNSFFKKRYLPLFFALLVISLTSFAQNVENKSTEKMQTLFSRNAKITGFGSVVNQLSYTNTSKIQSFYSIGAEGGVLFNHRFYMGFYGLTSLAPTDISTWSNTTGSISTDNRNLRLIQTGGLIGYKFFPHKIVHVNMNTKIGGAFMIDEQSSGRLNRYDNATVSQAFLTVNPTINVELNMFRWMQVFAGVGYNFMSGGETFNINPNKDLSTPTVQFGLSFGRF
jgi:hypothetical protein